MLEKNIFISRYFLSLDISDFSLCKIATSPKKGHPLFLSNPPLKMKVLSIPHPLFENLIGGPTPPPPAEKFGDRGGGGGDYTVRTRNVKSDTILCYTGHMKFLPF